MLEFAQVHFFIFPKIVMEDPLKDAMLICTNGSSSGTEAGVVNSKGYVVKTDMSLAQIVELLLWHSSSFQIMHLIYILAVINFFLVF